MVTPHPPTGTGIPAIPIDIDFLVRIAYWAALGGLYSLADFFDKRENHRLLFQRPANFSKKRFLRPVGYGVLAGAGLAIAGVEFSPGALETALTALLTMAVPFADKTHSGGKKVRQQVKESRQQMNYESRRDQ